MCFQYIAITSWEATNADQFYIYPLMSLVKTRNLQSPISWLKFFSGYADVLHVVFDIHNALRISGYHFDPPSSTVPNPTKGSAPRGTSDFSHLS